ncbi:hypothetical protein H8S95_15990 [Pontibacter sp. KCTC 32443]|uniref:hypothetical protein n=1 Tax=Pontibacter TaxID=323449 RepID=UPI00164E85B9|nr:MULTISPECIES: hypothetical protein [Pontibacter]MBC5775578.1 hypothetical protein [Pontibacter sp. KCTC 32443]
MKIFLILLLLLSVTLGTSAQSIPASTVDSYNWIYLKNGSRPLKGVTVQASDSSLHFVNESFLVRNTVPASIKPLIIPVTHIDKIKYRRRNNIIRVGLIGALGGAALGALIGYASGDDTCESGSWCMVLFSAEDKAMVGSILGILPGMGIGMAIGSYRKTIYINGAQSTYSLTRDELKKYTLTKQ